jgi:hypothetical protein
MPAFSPEAINVMRAALVTAVTQIPSDQVTQAIKVRMAEIVLKEAAKGRTTYEDLLAAASDQIQTVLRMLT